MSNARNLADIIGSAGTPVVTSNASFSANVAVTGAATFSNTVAVTGTLTTSANVNFDSNLLFVDGVNNRVGVNTTGGTGSTRFQVDDNTGNGQIRARHSTGLGILINQASANGAGYINVQDNANLILSANNSDKMAVSANGNVGIGTTSPNERLKVVGGNTQVPRHSYLGSSATGNPILVGTSGGAQIQFVQSGDDDELSFITHYSGVSHREAMRINRSGYTTIPYQPSFEVSQASLTNISGANYYFTYSIIHHNIGSHYNASNGRFTVPVTGVYLFQAVAMGVASTNPHIAFSINGATNGGGGNYGNNNMWEHGSYSQNANWIRTVHIIKLTAGDYIRVQSYDYSSVSQPERCYFGGHLLG